MRKRTLLWWSAFLVALVVLGGLAQWRAQRAASEALPPTPTPPPGLFPARFAEQAQRLELYQGERLLLALERDEQGQWQPTQQEPPTDQDWNTLVPLLLSSRVLAQLPLETPRSDVGLAQPRAVLRVSSMGTFYNLEIGDATPVGDGYYVRRVPRGEIFVLPAALIEPWLQLLASTGTPTPESAPTPSPGG